MRVLAWGEHRGPAAATYWTNVPPPAPASVPAVRILVVAVGSRGDVVPCTGVGARLQQEGHVVTVAAHPSYADLVHGAGLGFHGLPGDLGVLLDLPQRATPAYQAGRIPRLTELLS